MTLEEAIKHCEVVAEQEECFINYPHSDIVLGDLDIESRKHYVAEQKQLAEWLTELKEWKENPFRQIKAECKENYYCNNCVFIDHCPFSNGNRVAAEYPMDWVIY